MWVLLISVAIAGCAVGPDFKEPSLSGNEGYSQKKILVGGQKLVDGGNIPADWWNLFHSQAMDAIVRKALANNPGLEAARASLRAAQEQVGVARSSLYPGINISGDHSRNEITGASSGQSTSLHNVYSLTNATVAVTYAFDLAGGKLRALESAEAASDYQKFEFEAASLALSANLVIALLQEAALREQIETIHQIINAEQQQFQIAEAQYNLGAISGNSHLQKEASLARIRASLPPLEKAAAQLRNQIAALSGEFPNQNSEGFLSISSLSMPDELPLTIPSELVRQRPDIRAAEEQLHQASANVGVAIANQYPQISLSADWGRQSLGSLFHQSGVIYSLGGSITQPIWEGGRLSHERSAAEAQLDMAQALYRNVVLQAFQNVADVLQAIAADGAAMNVACIVEKKTSDSFSIARQQYSLGAISGSTLLSAEQNWLQARIVLSQARASLLADNAALFQAMGGGWWNREERTGGKKSTLPLNSPKGEDS